MSAKPTPRSAPTRAALRPVFQAHTGRSPWDVLLIVAGITILVGIAYVGYRTQVLGETLDEALPFLADKTDPAAGDTANPDPSGALPEPGHTPSKKTFRRLGAPAPAESSDPENTFFGRRVRRSPGPTESTPAPAPAPAPAPLPELTPAPEPAPAPAPAPESAPAH